MNPGLAHARQALHHLAPSSVLWLLKYKCKQKCRRCSVMSVGCIYRGYNMKNIMFLRISSAIHLKKSILYFIKKSIEEII
jgi:hypothetical protein